MSRDSSPEDDKPSKLESFFGNTPFGGLEDIDPDEELDTFSFGREDKEETPNAPQIASTSQQAQRWADFSSISLPSTSRERPSSEAASNRERDWTRFSDTSVSSSSSSTDTDSSSSPQTLPPDLEYYDVDTLDQHKPISYSFQTMVGRGGFCSVYKGIDKQNERYVAIKRMKVGVGNASMHHIIAERNILDVLKDFGHNNIVEFYDLIVCVDRAYFISELSPIGDLFNILQVPNSSGIRVWEPLREHESRHLISGVASGLLHINEMGIAHGDVKPSNILLFWNIEPTPEDTQDIIRYDRMTAKLTDFGNSKMEGPGDPDGKVMATAPRCTINYASPESYEIRVRYDMIAADYFSLGASLLAMLLGARPFDPPMIPPIPSDNDFFEKLGVYKKFITKMKKDVNYIKSICNVFNPQLRDVLIRLLDPLPQSRMTVQEFLESQWISKPYSREFEETYPEPSQQTKKYSRDF